MKRMSEEEAKDAVNDFAQKTARTLAPKISTAKRWLKRIGAVVLLLLCLPFLFSGATVFGLIILGIGLYLAAGGFLNYKLEKIAAALIFILFGIAIGLTGYSSYQSGVDSKDWPTVSGVIIQSEIETRTSTTGEGANRKTVEKSYPRVKYEFSVNGRSFVSNAIKFGQSADAYKTVARYPVGQIVAVFYNPDKPDQAVLEPGADPTFSIGFMGLGVIFIIIGFLAAAKYRKMSKALA